MSKSIYGTLCEAMTTEGRLPINYELPHEETHPNEVKWMVGAKDGLGIFHMVQSDSEKIVAKMLGYLKSKNAEKIAAVVQKQGVLQFIDPLLNSIRENRSDFDLEDLYGYANSLAFESDDAEMVKLGIALLGLFQWKETPEEIKGKLITLGLYEEFTLYVLVAVGSWSECNDIIFHIAQNVYGWGKIHAVERLEPETDEIKDWIIRHGCENAVMDAYLGLECANKGDLVGLLRQDDIDTDLFDSICIVIDALTDESPVKGISVYEYADEAILRFLRFADQYAVTLKHIWHVLNIAGFLAFAEMQNKDEPERRCKEIINKPIWRDLVLTAVAEPESDDFFYAVNVANRLNIDVKSQIFEAVKKDPLGKSMYVSGVYENPAYAKELTEMYEQILPLEEMSKGMGDYIFSPTHNKECNCLDSLLRSLCEYPLLGERLVKTGLLSPVTRNRNIACMAIKKWCEKLSKPLAEFSPSLSETLKSVAAVEINEDTKKTMHHLITGEYPDDIKED
jgi:hypothetical protein